MALRALQQQASSIERVERSKDPRFLESSTRFFSRFRQPALASRACFSTVIATTRDREGRRLNADIALARSLRLSKT